MGETGNGIISETRNVCVRVRFAILLFALPALVFSQGGQRPGQLKVNAKDGQRYAWIRPGTFTVLV
jgi:hypothetical protein